MVIADDHPRCREAATLGDAPAHGGDLGLLVLDLGLPDSRGIASLIDARRARHATPILVVGAGNGVDTERLERACTAGLPLEALGRELSDAVRDADRDRRADEATAAARLTAAVRC